MPDELTAPPYVAGTHVSHAEPPVTRPLDDTGLTDLVRQHAAAIRGAGADGWALGQFDRRVVWGQLVDDAIAWDPAVPTDDCTSAYLLDLRLFGVGGELHVWRATASPKDDSAPAGAGGAAEADEPGDDTTIDTFTWRLRRDEVAEGTHLETLDEPHLLWGDRVEEAKSVPTDGRATTGAETGRERTAPPGDAPPVSAAGTAAASATITPSAGDATWHELSQGQRGLRQRVPWPGALAPGDLPLALRVRSYLAADPETALVDVVDWRLVALCRWKDWHTEPEGSVRHD